MTGIVDRGDGRGYDRQMKRSRTRRQAQTVARLLVVAASLSCVRIARADTATPSAVEMKSRADAALLAGRPTDAIDLYQRLFERTGDTAMLYNLGQAHYTMGVYPRAYEYYRRFQSEGPLTVREQVPQLSQLLSDVRSRITSLQIRTTVVGATVFYRATRIGVTPLPRDVFVNAGEAEIEVAHEGFVTYRSRVLLRGGEDFELDVKLVEHATARPAAPVSVPIVQRWWFWLAVGTSVVGGGVVVYALSETKAPATGTLGRIAGGISF